MRDIEWLKASEDYFSALDCVDKSLPIVAYHEALNEIATLLLDDVDKVLGFNTPEVESEDIVDHYLKNCMVNRVLKEKGLDNLF